MSEIERLIGLCVEHVPKFQRPKSTKPEAALAAVLVWVYRSKCREVRFDALWNYVAVDGPRLTNETLPDGSTVTQIATATLATLLRAHGVEP